MFKKAITIISMLILVGCATVGNLTSYGLNDEDSMMEHFRVYPDKFVERVVEVEPPWITKGEDIIRADEEIVSVDVIYIVEFVHMVLLRLSINEETVCLALTKAERGFIPDGAEEVMMANGVMADCDALDGYRTFLIEQIENTEGI